MPEIVQPIKSKIIQVMGQLHAMRRPECLNKMLELLTRTSRRATDNSEAYISLQDLYTYYCKKMS